MKRNLTIQLDEEVIEGVKAVAAQRGTSVSGLVSAYLSQLTTEHEQYEKARQDAMDLLNLSVDRGTWKWRREDAYAERLDGYGP